MPTELDDARYVSLLSYKRDGGGVPTPVWAAPLDGKLVIFTARDSYKVKRIGRNPKVRVARCDVRGRLLGPWLDGTCAIVEDAERQRLVMAALRRKYGWQIRVLDFFALLGGRVAACDGLTLFREQPGAVLLPESEQQVVAILKACHAARIPVIARGAGTGLSGGVLPDPRGVILSLAKFQRIIAIDPLARTATVQPGVRNLVISQAAAPYGLYYAPDPSSQIACTIGGNVAENSGGVHCLKYGLTVHNVRRVRAVLMSGEAVEFGSEALDAPGYDLLALITGSEGLLGVITEVTVKLTPKAQDAKCVLAAFDDVTKAGAAVAAIIGAGIIPSGLEMMDRLTIRAVEPFVHAGYPEAEAILLCESDGVPEEVAAEVETVMRLMKEAGADLVQVSTSDAQRARFWSGRKAAFPAAGRISPDYYCMDGTIPRRALAPVLKRITELSKEYGLPCMNVFHAGDGNLHPLILYDANRPGDAAKTQAFGAKVLELCVEVGGTITGEHGVGIEKIGDMCVQFAPAELERFHGVKRAFDPESLLNPGKAVPTLHRCAEMGRMHVHRGALPHPDLPRF